jgi:hypothetical protein
MGSENIISQLENQIKQNEEYWNDKYNHVLD